jgi:hypothetical protein
MMVIKPSDLFNTCILKKKVTENKHYEPELEQESFILKETKIVDEILGKDVPPIISESPVHNGAPENIVTELAAEIKIDTSNQYMNELCEVDFNLDEMPETETVSIKQRNDVYYKMYREAKEKAKIARDLALSAYLEAKAKRIKNTYMLDDIIDSSDSEESGEESEVESDEEDETENTDE